MKRSILVQHGNLIDACREVIGAIISLKIPIFEKDECLVRISEQGIKYIDIWHLSTLLSDHFIFTNGAKNIECHERLLRMLLSKQKWGLPQLKGISRAPYLFNEQIIDKEGYNPESKIFLMNSLKIEPLPSVLNKKVAQEALDVLKAPFLKFPYKFDHGLSVVLSAVLTGLIRKDLYSSPLHAFTAPKMATGKSLLCSLIGLIVTGKSTAVVNQSINEAEDSKRFLSLLLEGEPVICIDNVERPVQSSTLCSILTEPLFKGRILGKTQLTPNCSTAALFLINGNNMVVYGDLSSRTISCSLDAKVEHPEKRNFSGDIRAEVLASRSKLLHAAFTVLCAYMQEKKKPSVTPFGRFEDWSKTVRESLIWLGMHDPCNSLEEINKSDPVRINLRRLFHNWHVLSEGMPSRIKDIVDMARSLDEGLISINADFKEAAITFLETAQTVTTTRKSNSSLSSRILGKYFSKYEGRIEGGYRIERVSTLQRSERWQTINVADNS